MQQSRGAQARRWTALCMVAMALALFVLWNVSRRMVHMQSAAAASSAQRRAGAKAGAELKAVVQLTGIQNGSAEGVLLEKQSETVYRKTSEVLRMEIPTGVNVVMGTANDVHKDAVVHVTGTVGDDKVLHASRIVILTVYVSVQ